MTQVLIIALILIAAIVYVRHKNSRERRQALAREAEQSPPSRAPMIAALLLVVITLGISGAFYYLKWQESRQLFTVQVINSHSGEVQTYYVYRDDINGRSFRTVEGRQINLSSAERMEVQKGVIDPANGEAP